MPTTGFYGISATIFSTATNFSTWFTLGVNGVAVSFMTQDATAVNRHTAYIQRYFTKDDAVTLTLTPNVNFTLNLVAEGSANESPYIHFVQLTGVI
jgi:outer membrane receptor for monomeric catechols